MMSNSTDKRAAMITAMVEYILDISSNTAVYNDRTGESFDMDELLDSFPEIDEETKEAMKERSLEDS